MRSRLHSARRLLVPITVAAVAGIAAPAAHGAVADATLTGGTLNFINGTPGNVSFPSVTLDGTDRVTSRTQPFDVSDARGTGTGWNITATSTTFTSGGNSLPTTATTLASAPAIACDAGITCTPASGTGVSYPYTLPAAAVAPAATRIVSAAANSGLGAQTITPNWQLSIPASARAGSYTSTWTFSLVSGP